MNVQIQTKKSYLPNSNACEWRVSTTRGGRGWEREKKEIVEMHEIGTDSRRDEFPDNIQLIHSSI